MLKHIVLWKIHKDGSEEDRLETLRRFADMTADLCREIPQIKEARVAYNIHAAGNFHICIDSLFESREDLDVYINHPDHLKVRAFLDSRQYEKTVFDYEF